MSDLSDGVKTGEIVEEAEGQEVSPSGMLARVDRAEIDMQIATARKYGRSITKFNEDARLLATLDAPTAGAMFYTLKRDGKRIEGPSIRLAEIAVSCYGNLRIATRVTDIGDKFVTGQGMAFDLEKNIAVAVEVRRRITTREGRRYSDDMIATTANAATSIALRNAVFRVIPQALVKPIYDAAKQVALGKGLTIEQQRTAALKYYADTYKAKEADVLRFLGRAGVADITLDDLVDLKGLATAIQDGETTWENALADATGGSSNGKSATRVQAGGLSVEALQKGKIASADDAHGKTTDEVRAKADAPKNGTAAPAATATGEDDLDVSF